jgi:hypothetical protein
MGTRTGWGARTPAGICSRRRRRPRRTEEGSPRPFSAKRCVPGACSVTVCLPQFWHTVSRLRAIWKASVFCGEVDGRVRHHRLSGSTTSRAGESIRRRCVPALVARRIFYIYQIASARGVLVALIFGSPVRGAGEGSRLLRRAAETSIHSADLLCDFHRWEALMLGFFTGVAASLAAALIWVLVAHQLVPMIQGALWKVTDISGKWYLYLDDPDSTPVSVGVMTIHQRGLRITAKLHRDQFHDRRPTDMNFEYRGTFRSRQLVLIWEAVERPDSRIGALVLYLNEYGTQFRGFTTYYDDGARSGPAVIAKEYWLQRPSRLPEPRKANFVGPSIQTSPWDASSPRSETEAGDRTA